MESAPACNSAETDPDNSAASAGKVNFVDLICTNVCTCIYEYNITYAVTLVTLFAPTCFDHT